MLRAAHFAPRVSSPSEPDIGGKRQNVSRNRAGAIIFSSSRCPRVRRTSIVSGSWLATMFGSTIGVIPSIVDRYCTCARK